MPPRHSAASDRMCLAASFDSVAHQCGTASGERSMARYARQPTPDPSLSGRGKKKVTPLLERLPPSSFFADKLPVGFQAT